MTLDNLAHPPIVEVVSGVIFEEVLELDPARVGLYWAQHRNRYAAHELRPPVVDEQEAQVGERTRMRSWLVSDDEQYVLQLQPDRLYVNWRRRGMDYPHFNTRESPGVLDRTMDELKRVQTFCATELGTPLAPSKIELAKIDRFDYTDLDDLVRQIPCLGPMLDVAGRVTPDLSVSVTDNVDGVQTAMVLSSAVGASLTPALRCDTFASRAVGADEELRAPFQQLNAALNRVFERLVSEEALAKFRGALAKG